MTVCSFLGLGLVGTLLVLFFGVCVGVGVAGADCAESAGFSVFFGSAGVFEQPANETIISAISGVVALKNFLLLILIPLLIGSLRTPRAVIRTDCDSALIA